MDQRVLYAHIGISTHNSAELWVVRQRLHLAWGLGFKFMTLDIDFELIISWLTSNAVMALEQAPLVFILQDHLGLRVDRPSTSCLW